MGQTFALLANGPEHTFSQTPLAHREPSRIQAFLAGNPHHRRAELPPQAATAVAKREALHLRHAASGDAGGDLFHGLSIVRTPPFQCSCTHEYPLRAAAHLCGGRQLASGFVPKFVLFNFVRAINCNSNRMLRMRPMPRSTAARGPPPRWRPRCGGRRRLLTRRRQGPASLGVNVAVSLPPAATPAHRGFEANT